MSEHAIEVGALPEPTPTVGIKLASLAVHAQEAISADGHEFDLAAMQSILADPEVAEYMQALDALALLPKARRPEA